MSIQVIDEEQIRRCLNLADLIDPVRAAFIAHSRGLSSGAISHLEPNDGKVHVKTGYAQGSPFYVVKVASGFRSNRARNLPVWDGVIVVFSADTGAMIAIIEDHGLLTDWRTAAAGAIATHSFVGSRQRQLGVVGTGLQAYWQPLAHKVLMNLTVSPSGAETRKRVRTFATAWLPCWMGRSYTGNKVWRPLSANRMRS